MARVPAADTRKSTPRATGEPDHPPMGSDAEGGGLGGDPPSSGQGMPIKALVAGDRVKHDPSGVGRRRAAEGPAPARGSVVDDPRLGRVRDRPSRTRRHPGAGRRPECLGAATPGADRRFRQPLVAAAHGRVSEPLRGGSQGGRSWPPPVSRTASASRGRALSSPARPPTDVALGKARAEQTRSSSGPSDACRRLALGPRRGPVGARRGEQPRAAGADRDSVRAGQRRPPSDSSPGAEGERAAARPRRTTTTPLR